MTVVLIDKQKALAARRAEQTRVLLDAIPKPVGIRQFPNSQERRMTCRELAELEEVEASRNRRRRANEAQLTYNENEGWEDAMRQDLRDRLARRDAEATPPKATASGSRDEVGVEEEVEEEEAASDGNGDGDEDDNSNAPTTTQRERRNRRSTSKVREAEKLQKERELERSSRGRGRGSGRRRGRGRGGNSKASQRLRAMSESLDDFEPVLSQRPVNKR